jgi:hypothetical protein
MLLGQLTVGGVLSFTVTVNEQPGPADEVQLTVVAPTGKKEPDDGEQLTMPQLPVVVGSG